MTRLLLLFAFWSTSAHAAGIEDCESLKTFRTAYAFCRASFGEVDTCTTAAGTHRELGTDLVAQCRAHAKKSTSSCADATSPYLTAICDAFGRANDSACARSKADPTWVGWCRGLLELDEAKCAAAGDLKKECGLYVTTVTQARVVTPPTTTTAEESQSEREGEDEAVEPVTTTPVRTSRVPAPDLETDKNSFPGDIRGRVALAEGTDTEILDDANNIIKSMENYLEGNGKIAIVDDQEALAKALAADNGQPDDWPAQLEKIKEDVSTGFTAKDGTVFLVRTAAIAHDRVHESVHVLSAQGGRTQILEDFNVSLNEGFTEYFTMAACQRQNIRSSGAYATQLAFVERIIAVVGVAAATQAYLGDGGLDAIITTLAERWVGRRQGIIDANSTNGTIKFSARALVPPESVEAAKPLLQAQLVAWKPTDAGWKKFWAEGVGI